MFPLLSISFPVQFKCHCNRTILSYICNYNSQEKKQEIKNQYRNWKPTKSTCLPPTQPISYIIKFNATKVQTNQSIMAIAFNRNLKHKKKKKKKIENDNILNLYRKAAKYGGA